jgi:hypothetical protein
MSLRKSLSFADGFTVGAARAADAGHDQSREFDWDKAAKLIAQLKPKVAHAGLAEDWDYTSGVIWKGGKPVPKSETYTYLASNWATPLLVCDGKEIPCWKAGNNSGAYWPAPALKKLKR